MNMVGSSNPIQFKVDNLGVVHKADFRRRPWVTKPRKGTTFEDCITRITFGKEQAREVRIGINQLRAGRR